MEPADRAIDLVPRENLEGRGRAPWPWRIDPDGRALVLAPQLTTGERLPFILTPALVSLPPTVLSVMIAVGWLVGGFADAESRQGAGFMLSAGVFVASIPWLFAAARLANAREAAERQARRTPVLLRLTGESVELPASGATIPRGDILGVRVREDRSFPGIHWHTPLVVEVAARVAGDGQPRSIPIGVFLHGRAEAERYAQAAREILATPTPAPRLPT